MGCDYYIETELVICCKGQEKVKLIRLRVECGYFGYCEVDSDDEDCDEKYRHYVEMVLSRYKKEKLLFNNGQFITEKCRDKYSNMILDAINEEDPFNEEEYDNNPLTMDVVDTVTKKTFAYRRS
jgi:hypothetical protein